MQGRQYKKYSEIVHIFSAAFILAVLKAVYAVCSLSCIVFSIQLSCLSGPVKSALSVTLTLYGRHQTVSQLHNRQL